jgi:hypothetical protein
LRAAELQSRRIQSIEASRYDGVMAAAAHPDVPDVRVVPPGALVESAVPPILLAAPVPSARGVERLQQPTVLSKPSEPIGARPEGAAPTVPLPLPAPTAIRPGQPRAQPHSVKSTATVGVPKSTGPVGAAQARRPSEPLPIVPSFSRAD